MSKLGNTDISNEGKMKEYDLPKVRHDMNPSKIGNREDIIIATRKA